MFRKLLKHDFRAVWPTLGILSLVALGAGAAGSGLVRYFDHGTHGDFWEVMGILAMVAVMFYLIAYSVVALFLLLGRFYQSRFTDEGYLTFTLPVTTHQILLSSTLNCFLGILAAIAVTVVSFGIFVFFGLSSLDGERLEFIRLCFQKLPEWLDMLGVGNILLFLFTALAELMAEVLKIMLAITIGAVLVKKHKILVSIVFYYVLNTAVSILVFSGALAGVLNFTEEMTESLFRSAFSVGLVFSAVMSAACYFAMYLLVHKKLNLN